MTLPTTMQSLQLLGPNRLGEARVPVPVPRRDEVLIRTSATTICTSDINDVAHNPFGIVLPRTLGHEGAGIVVAVGAEVGDLKMGDRVAVHPVIHCRNCHNCRRGREHLCSQMEHLGFNREGTFAEYFCVRSDRARRVPESLDLAVAALLEPVSVCLHALKRARLEENETLLVVGDGPFGILMGRLASRRKPRQIIIVGRHPFRLQQLKGAFPIHRRAADETEAAVKAAAGGEGVDVAVLAVGAQSALDLCMSSLRAQGRLVVFSAIPDRCSLDLFRLHTQEIEMLGACNDQNLIDDALVELAEPENHLAALVTHRLPFVQWPHAFELARERKDQALKVALIFGGTS